MAIFNHNQKYYYKFMIVTYRAVTATFYFKNIFIVVL